MPATGGCSTRSFMAGTSAAPAAGFTVTGTVLPGVTAGTVTVKLPYGCLATISTFSSAVRPVLPSLKVSVWTPCAASGAAVSVRVLLS